MLSSSFSQSLIFSFLLLGLCIVLSAISTRRRLKASELKKNWLFAPCALFLLMGCIIIFTDHHSTYWLLLMPALLSSLLLTYPEKINHPYVLGYFGPVDLSEFSKTKTSHRASRIEPTLATNQKPQEAQPTSYYEPITEATAASTTTPDSRSNEQSDIGENIRLALLQSKNTVIAILTVLTLIICSIIISTTRSSTEPAQELRPELNMPVAVTRLDKINLPDDFSLLLSTFDGIVIHWQADESSKTTLWSQESAAGDKSCSVIKFNNGDEIRTLTVNVEQGSSYYASFSPLDSTTIVKSLALRGKFSLCGYNFSLKGSQAVLGKHPKYADFLTN